MVDKTKLEELKKKSQLTDEERAELAELEKQFSDESEQARYNDLMAKEEAQLTSEEVDELIKLGEKFGEPEGGKPGAGTEPAKKYAGIYDTPEKLIEGLLSSEQERKRITEEMAKDPELATVVESAYKDSQRVVTKLVSGRRAAPRVGLRKPLGERELEEMTAEEYDAWEKSNKLEAHSWLAGATSKSVQVNASRRNVFKKYPSWFAEIQGVIPASKELTEWDRLDKEGDLEIDKSQPNWPEQVMAKMESNLGIVKAPPKKPVTLKPGFEQGKGGGAGAGGKKRLTDAEFEALSDDERTKYLEDQKPK